MRKTPFKIIMTICLLGFAYIVYFLLQESQKKFVPKPVQKTSLVDSVTITGNILCVWSKSDTTCYLVTGSFKINGYMEWPNDSTFMYSKGYDTTEYVKSVNGRMGTVIKK